MTADVLHPGADDAAGRSWQSLLPLYGFLLYLLFKPFYVFAPGSLQPADLVVLGVCGMLLLVGTVPPSPRSSRVLFGAGLFVLYVILVNIVWALLVGRGQFLKISSFYVFNFGVLFVVLALADRYGDVFFRHTVVVAAASLLLQAAISFVAQTDARRQVVHFNNPNQLGHWTLLSATMFFVCALRVHVRPVLKVAVCCASLYLVALSLSKAALISITGLFLLAFVTRPRQLLVVLPIVAVLILALSNSQLYENVMWRLGNIGHQADDDLGVRGYYLIGRFPQYLFLGAGQGAYDRFYAWNPREFHSTLGTVFFCYGVVGSVLFVSFLYQVFRGAGLYRFAFLVPVFAFGVTHQGLRFSIFWALLAVVASARFEPREAAAVP